MSLAQRFEHLSHNMESWSEHAEASENDNAYAIICPLYEQERETQIDMHVSRTERRSTYNYQEI